MRMGAGRGDAPTSYRAVGGADAPLALAEVKQLWWFLDGSIMSPGTRHHLWRSWGFCSRHTWAHAVVECELRVQPFSTAILYEDLVARAARALRRPGPAALAMRRLRSRAACLTCDYLTLPSGGSNPFLVEQWRRANRLERTRVRLAASRATWLPRSCPACAGGAGPVCRPHLLAGAATMPAPARRELADELDRLSRRLYLLVKSMGWQRSPTTPEVEAAWIEALGWFAGWEFPVRLSVQPGAGGNRP